MSRVARMPWLLMLVLTLVGYHVTFAGKRGGGILQRMDEPASSYDDVVVRTRANSSTEPPQRLGGIRARLRPPLR